MEISSLFREILKSIDYHVNHLSKDFFSNEERLPELLPIFTWFYNNISPKSNCVTPRELTLYTSVLSKHDYSSLEKISKAMNKFYDKSTKDSIVSSSDLETLEEKIFKSQKELNDLKSHSYVYEKKINMIDDEIALLKQKENVFDVSCYQAKSNLDLAVKNCTEKVADLGSNICKIHDHVTNSMTNDSECLTKLTSKTLTDSTDEWHQKIYKIINIWFNEKTTSPETNDKLVKNHKIKLHKLGLLFKSVAALRMTEMDLTCEIASLNYAITNMFSIQNSFNESQENLQSTNLNLSKNFTNHQEVTIDLSQRSSSSEYDEFLSHVYATIIIGAQNKFTNMKKIEDSLTFIQESTEKYIMICDVLWCLMRTGCSMTNLKCELLLNSIDILDKIFHDIKCTQEWTPNSSKNLAESSNLSNDNNTFIFSEIAKFDESYLNIYTNSTEVEQLTEMVKLWKSKYHYSNDECNQLTILQQKLQVHSDAVNELTKTYSKAT